MKLQLTLLFTLFSSFILKSQDSISWSSYLPEQKIDSLVYLSTNTSYLYPFRKADSLNYSDLELKTIKDDYDRKMNFYTLRKFPLGDVASALEYYEIRHSTADTNIIAKILTYMPSDITDKPKNPVMRCSDYIFRDVFILYQKSEPVMSVSICLTCNGVSITPADHRANYVLISETGKTLIDIGFIDLFSRRVSFY